MSNREQFKSVLESILDFVDALEWKPEDITYYPEDGVIRLTWYKGNREVDVCSIDYIPDNYYPEWKWSKLIYEGGTCLTLPEAYKALMSE